ncbi:MAG: hypothetical protein COA79_26615, partial [Planctomycetota bacterium]
ATTNVQIRVKTTDSLVDFLDGYYDLVNGVFVKTSATHVCYYTLTKDVFLQPINQLRAYENGVLVYDKTQVAHQDLYQSETPVFVNNTQAYIVTAFIAFSQKSIEFYDSNPGGAELEHVEILEYNNEGEVIIRRMRETLNGPDLSYSKVVSSTNLNGDGIITTSKMFEGQEVSMIEEYDTFGNMVKMTEYNGAITLYEYLTSDPELESDGLITKMTDAIGHETYFQYDGFGREVLIWGATTNPGLTTYNANGNIESFERKIYIPQPGDENLTVDQYQYDPTLSVDRYVYDGQNLITQTTEDVNGLILTTTSMTYDGRNFLETTTDNTGLVTKYFYDSVDRQFKTVTDFGGLDITSITTFNNKNLMTHIDYEGLISETQYDSLNRVIKTIQDPNGFAIETNFAYNFNGYQSSMTDHKGNVTSYEFDPLGRQNKMTDMRGVVSATEFDINGNVTEQINDEGAGQRNRTVELEYDINDNNILMRSDPSETYVIISTTEYDLLNRTGTQTSNVGADEIITVVEFDSFGNLTSTITDLGPNSKTTSSAFDDFGRLTSQTDIKGVVTDFEYDALDRQILTTYDLANLNVVTETVFKLNGLVDKTINARGIETTIQYDTLDRQTGSTFDPGASPAANLSTSQVYNDRNQVTSTTSQTGVVTEFEYDSLGRRFKTIVDPTGDNRITTLTFDSSGDITVVNDPANNNTTRVYNTFRELTSVTNAKGHVTSFEYDIYGAQTKVTDNDLVETVTVYDDRGLMTSQTQDDGGLGLVTSFVYDELARVVEATDPEGKKISTTYNKFGQVLITTDDVDGLAVVTTNEYDLLTLQLIKITDNAGAETTYDYDEYLRLTAEVYDDTKSKNYTYNNFSQRLTIEDQRANTTTFTYDSFGRLEKTKITNLDPFDGAHEMNYTYDSEFRLETADSIGGKVASLITRHYDSFNRLTSEDQKIGTVTKTVSKTFDDIGRLDTVSYPSGRGLTYQYDSTHQVTNIYDTNTPADDYVSYTYNNRNLVATKTLGNGLELTKGYDAVYRTTSQEWQNVGLTTVAGFDYKYDNVGNRKVEIGLHNANKSAVYNYDTTYKVTGYKQGVLNGAEDDVPSTLFFQDWTQDALGNWDTFNNNGVTDTRSHDSMNQITSTGFTHDDTGNMTSDGSNDYEFDAMNRLIKATVGSVVTEYSYDAFNRRIQKDADGVVTNFVYWGSQSIEEQDALGILIRDFVYGGRYIDEIVMFNDSTNDYYHLIDYRFSVIALSDASGNIVERYEYTPFGERTITDNSYSVISVSVYGVKYGFTGRRHDSETGVMYFRARYYSGLLGRFLSRDPLGFVDGMGLHNGYFGVNGLDPSGNEIYLVLDPSKKKDKDRTLTIGKKTYSTKKDGYKVIFNAMIKEWNDKLDDFKKILKNSKDDVKITLNGKKNAKKSEVLIEINKHRIHSTVLILPKGHKAAADALVKLANSLGKDDQILFETHTHSGTKAAPNFHIFLGGKPLFLEGRSGYAKGINEDFAKLFSKLSKEKTTKITFGACNFNKKAASKIEKRLAFDVAGFPGYNHPIFAVEDDTFPNKWLFTGFGSEFKSKSVPVKDENGKTKRDSDGKVIYERDEKGKRVKSTRATNWILTIKGPYESAAFRGGKTK